MWHTIELVLFTWPVLLWLSADLSLLSQTVSIYIDVNMQYTQSNTSTQTVNISSLRRSADVPLTVRRRSTAVLPTCHTKTLPHGNFVNTRTSAYQSSLDAKVRAFLSLALLSSAQNNRAIFCCVWHQMKSCIIYRSSMNSNIYQPCDSYDTSVKIENESNKNSLAWSMLKIMEHFNKIFTSLPTQLCNQQ